MSMQNGTRETLDGRRGLMALSEGSEQPAVVSGLLSGSAIALTMLLAPALVDAVTTGMTRGLVMLLSIVVAGLAGGLLQQVWFNPRVLGLGWGYPARIAAFGSSYFAVLAACAWVGEFLPREAGPWVSFVVFYLVFLALMTALFSRIYHKEASEYAKGLADWRARREDGAGC